MNNKNRYMQIKKTEIFNVYNTRNECNNNLKPEGYRVVTGGGKGALAPQPLLKINF